MESIIDNSLITCDEVIESNDEEIKTIPTNFNEKIITCKAQNLYAFLLFLLITIAFLLTVSIYCCLIKYQQNWNINYHFLNII